MIWTTVLLKKWGEEEEETKFLGEIFPPILIICENNIYKLLGCSVILIIRERDKSYLTKFM